VRAAAYAASDFWQEQLIMKVFLTSIYESFYDRKRFTYSLNGLTDACLQNDR